MNEEKGNSECNKERSNGNGPPVKHDEIVVVH